MYTTGMRLEERSSGLRRLSPASQWTFAETSLLMKVETAVIRATVGCGDIAFNDTQFDKINFYTLNLHKIFMLSQCI